MDKKFEELKKAYQAIPIPSELDFVVKKALHLNTRKKRVHKAIASIAAATLFLIGGLNVSPAFAKSMEAIPVIGKVVHVVTFTEFNVNDRNYQATIEVPAIDNLENESLQTLLNEKYLDESKSLFEEFKEDMEELEKIGGGFLGVASGYEIKTDTDQILSIGRYVVNTVGSSSTSFQFDTIDKLNELLITLPSLFKNETYIDVISSEIKKQMLVEMERDNSIVYWVESNNGEKVIDPFTKISSEQSFYINSDSKLVVVFDKYEVAPGYMGVLEFIIPSEVLSNILVSNEYIK